VANCGCSSERNAPGGSFEFSSPSRVINQRIANQRIVSLVRSSRSEIPKFVIAPRSISNRGSRSPVSFAKAHRLVVPAARGWTNLNEMLCMSANCRFRPHPRNRRGPPAGHRTWRRCSSLLVCLTVRALYSCVALRTQRYREISQRQLTLRDDHRHICHHPHSSNISHHSRIQSAARRHSHVMGVHLEHSPISHVLSYLYRSQNDVLRRSLFRRVSVLSTSASSDPFS